MSGPPEGGRYVRVIVTDVVSAFSVSRDTVARHLTRNSRPGAERVLSPYNGRGHPGTEAEPPLVLDKPVLQRGPGSTRLHHW
jgi:hypothetical protein